MFYYIEGTVTLIKQGVAVIDCGGVGYACHASQNTIAGLKQGQRARLYTYLNVREGVFELYGFLSEEEQSCFLLLISVSGVGPRAALSILSVTTTDRLALAIITGEEKLLMQASGIGKKIAQRIVLELRDKMGKAQTAGEGGSSVVAFEQQAGGTVNHTQEAVAALMVLGYSQSEALLSMKGLDTASMETEQIVRHCLKALIKQ